METQENESPRRRARTASVASLELLIGAHPDALRDLYLAGRPADPSALGRRDGRLLAVERLAPAYMALRPLVSLFSRHVSPWRGKSFESGGTAGTDLVFGASRFRFQSEIAPSRLDGEPTLVLRYHDLGNPWPVRNVVAELRTVSGNHDAAVHIGPAFWRDETTPRSWWGLGPVT